MFDYESPLELLQNTIAEIRKDIEWYRDTGHTVEHRRERMKKLEESLAEYERAIALLKSE